MIDENGIEIPNYILEKDRGYIVNYILKEMTDVELNRVVRTANDMLYARLYYLKTKCGIKNVGITILDERE